MRRGLFGVRLALVAAVLLLLLGILGVLQYRWIGEVAEAERERMQRSVQSSAERVADLFDREVTLAFVAFRLPAELSADGAATWLAEEIRHWSASVPAQDLLRDVFVVEQRAGGRFALYRVGRTNGGAQPIAWPPEFETARRQLESAPPLPPPPGDQPGTPPRGAHGFVIEEIPALLSPARRRVPAPDDPGSLRTTPPALLTLVRLDRAALLASLRQLIRRYLGDGVEYDWAVLPAAGGREVIDRSRIEFDEAILRRPDAEVALFAVGKGRLNAPSRPAAPLPRIFGRSREGPRTRGPSTAAAAFGEGAWRLVVAHRAGSLEAAVAGVRRRNLAVSGGILLLLVGAVGTLVASVQRAQRLARQQTEFVAGITHELRTPLAAIRSAGENLADGVVGGAERVKHYGRLVEREARRLSELIEETLEHAGIESGRILDTSNRVSISQILDDARRACRWLSEEEGVTVEADVPAELSPIRGDAAALRKVFTNILTNAIKYGGRGNRVTLQVREKGHDVETTVEDRGPGIRPGDLPHIFEPFYRGREASSGPISGSGLGLSLVRRIVRAHGGRVEVESSPGNGTVFRVRLPQASDRPPAARAAS